jgi:hypothetical protein
VAGVVQLLVIVVLGASIAAQAYLAGSERQPRPGRYQLRETRSGHYLRLDSATGEVCWFGTVVETGERRASHWCFDPARFGDPPAPSPVLTSLGEAL